MTHRAAAAVAALAMLLQLAAPVLAGGWAEIIPDAQTTEPPVEGQPVEIGFVVLQHGQTPAPWEEATVQFTNASTGATVDVVATNDRPDGHFVASVTLPEAGYWSWQVTLRDLVSEQLPVALTVTTVDGRLPAYDPSTTATAIARAKQDVTADMEARLLPEIERLDNLLRANQAKIDRSIAQTNAIVAERDVLATRLAAAEAATDATATPASTTFLAVLTLAVLAGASAGFAMSWLSGRHGQGVTLNPGQREADRV